MEFTQKFMSYDKWDYKTWWFPLADQATATAEKYVAIEGNMDGSFAEYIDFSGKQISGAQVKVDACIPAILWWNLYLMDSMIM